MFSSNRNTDFTEKFFVRVDVTEEFPFLVTKMSPYYDRGESSPQRQIVSHGTPS